MDCRLREKFPQASRGIFLFPLNIPSAENSGWRRWGICFPRPFSSELSELWFWILWEGPELKWCRDYSSRSWKQESTRSQQTKKKNKTTKNFHRTISSPSLPIPPCFSSPPQNHGVSVRDSRPTVCRPPGVVHITPYVWPDRQVGLRLLCVLGWLVACSWKSKLQGNPW